MAMKNCKECGTEISKSAKECPKCGKSQKNFFQKHIVLTVILIIVALGVVAGAGGEIDTSSPNSNPIKTNTESEKFSLVSDKLTTDGFGTYIKGEIKNNTDKSYSYVQVTFNLYDSSGAQLGTAIDNINNLEPNGVWKYKAVGLTTEKVSSYKFVEITGW